MKKNLLNYFLFAAAIFLSANVFGQNSTNNASTGSNTNALVIPQSNHSNGSADIYPNPNNGEFNLNVSGYSEKAFVTVYNSMGQLILKEKVSGANHPVNLRSAAAGTYHLIVFDNNQPVYKTKFIKS